MCFVLHCTLLLLYTIKCLESGRYAIATLAAAPVNILHSSVNAEMSKHTLTDYALL